MRPSTLRLPSRCRAFAYAALTAAVLAVPAGPAVAQNVDAQALLDRIERLERDIRTLNIQIARGVSPEAAAKAAGSSPGGGGGAVGGPALARLGSRVDGMEGDMRDLTGRMEQMNHRLGQIEQRLDKLASDLEFRLSRLEGGSGGSMSGMAAGNGGGGGTSGPGAGGERAMAAGQWGDSQGGDMSSGREAPGPGTLGTIDPSAVEAVREAAAERDQQAAASGGSQGGGGMTSELPPLPGEDQQGSASSGGEAQQQAAVPSTADSTALPEGPPSEQYKHAFGLLRQGRYEDAATNFQQFLERHPDDQLAPNARYWLGETYYVRADYVSAAETFLEAYSQGAKAPKAPDSLLKLGMSLAQLDKIAEACAAFEKVRRDYPDAPAGLRSTLDREMSKHKCSS